MKYETRCTQITVAPEGARIFDINSYTVTLEDECSGEFVVVRDNGDNSEAGEIRIDSDSWLRLGLAIEKMIETCRGDE